MAPGINIFNKQEIYMYNFNKCFRITDVMKVKAVAIRASDAQRGDSKELIKGLKEKVTFRTLKDKWLGFESRLFVCKTLVLLTSAYQSLCISH